jgi:hypothetical protein
VQIRPSTINFFITGSQRSGTTLLRLLLNSHSQIAIPEEAGFLYPFLNKRILNQKRPLTLRQRQRFIRYLQNDEQFKKWNICSKSLAQLENSCVSQKVAIEFLYAAFAAKSNKEFIGDKSPKFIRKLKLLTILYPEAKFIHIVRDGRDTFLSLKRRQHHSAESALVSSAEWRVKEILIQRALGKIPNRAIRIRYEDLVQSPSQLLMKICRFLDVEFEPEMLMFWKTSKDYIDQQHSDLIYKPVEPKNIQKWKSGLTSRELDEYTFISRSLLKTYDYELYNQQPKLWCRFIYILKFLIYVPRRLIRIVWTNVVMRVARLLGRPVTQGHYE